MDWSHVDYLWIIVFFFLPDLRKPLKSELIDKLKEIQHLKHSSLPSHE